MECIDGVKCRKYNSKQLRGNSYKIDMFLIEQYHLVSCLKDLHGKSRINPISINCPKLQNKGKCLV